jgi:GNAT superfamily N-acetyltransferase
MELEIREAAASDIDEIVSFHNAALGDSQKPEHWTWEFGESYPDSSVFTIIRAQGQVVATQGMIPVYIYARGKRLLSGKSESTLVHPAYRGRGLFQNVYQFAVSRCQDRGMQFIWGFTAAVGAFKRVGFRTYGHAVYSSISILNLWGALNWVREQNIGAMKKMITFLMSFPFLIYSSLLRATCRFPDKGLVIREGLAHQKDLESLYGRLRERNPDLIHIHLDERYLRWRIYNHPIFKYRTYFVYEGDLLKAYAFVNMHDNRMAYLTDLTFESLGAGKFLLQSILREMNTAGTGAVMFFGNKAHNGISRTFKLLRRFGFMHIEAPVQFVLRNLSVDDEESLFDITNWYMNGLWTEGFQI